MSAKRKKSRADDVVVPHSRRGSDRITWVFLALFAVAFAVFLARNFFFGQPDPMEFRIGTVKMNSFGLLVGLGILFGFHLAKGECLASGADWDETFAMLTTTAFVGLIFAHVWDAVLYHPEQMWRHLLDLRVGLSSFGGVITAVLVHTYLVRARGLSLAERTDWLAYAFTGAWLYGRLACFSIHDHPGVETSFILGVHTRGALRHDLGLYEVLLTIPLFLLLTVLVRRPHRHGTITAVAGLVYLPARFFLDTLRSGDLTYAGLTPAQWLCLPAVAFFAYFAIRPGPPPDGGGQSVARAVGKAR